MNEWERMCLCVGGDIQKAMSLPRYFLCRGEKLPLDGFEHKGGKGRVWRAMDGCIPYMTIILLFTPERRFLHCGLPLLLTGVDCCQMQGDTMPIVSFCHIC
jgi:hypothetical protein